MNMHKNLGHPSNDRLSKALQVAGYRAEVVQAALELKCHICAACSPPKHQRPGTLKPLLDFNHKVYIDGINWKMQRGKASICITSWMRGQTIMWQCAHLPETLMISSA